MNNLANDITDKFQYILDEIPHLVLDRHGDNLVRYATFSAPYIKKTIRDIPPPQGEKAKSGLVISAGPSIHRREILKRIKASNFKGSVITVDGAYVGCLRMGIVPDYVMTLDPNIRRTVRWFGDPDFEENSQLDDYFARQDLAEEFRRNSIEHNLETIRLVNRSSHLTRAVPSAAIARGVVMRLLDAKFDIYWWNPLVDNPHQPDSITKKLYDINKAPAMNTGGTVGTAAWLFAATRLKLPVIGVVGMDYGYYRDNPIHETQHYPELIDKIGGEENIEDYFLESVFPLTGEIFYTDPTYYWYKMNFIEMLKKQKASVTYNCSEAGTLIDDSIQCLKLEEFLHRKF